MPPTPDPNPLQTLARLDAQVGYITESVLDLRRRVTAMQAEWRLQQSGKRPRFPVEFTSQFGEDLLCWELFQGRSEGFYIEAGAYDGYRASVSYAFEAVGWTGLLVEPLPDRYVQCKARRPASRVVHSALGPPGSPPETELTAIQDGEWDMSSFTGERTVTGGRAHTRVRVPLTTLDALLESHPWPGNVPSIDFAMIDVEGSEADVLRGFDLGRWRPTVLLLEDNTRGQDQRLNAHMRAQPYTPAGWLGVNQVYIRSDAVDLIRRAPQIRI